MKIREIAEMLRFDGLRRLPALAIDVEVKVCGRVSNVKEIKAILGSVEPT